MEQRALRSYGEAFACDLVDLLRRARWHLMNMLILAGATTAWFGGYPCYHAGHTCYEERRKAGPPQRRRRTAMAREAERGIGEIEALLAAHRQSRHPRQPG